jgi:predicted nucleic acid-binding protein
MQLKERTITRADGSALTIKYQVKTEEDKALAKKQAEIKQQIRELKANLSATDYQAIKYAEGELTLAEFSEVKNQRKTWREKINELESEL